MLNNKSEIDDVIPLEFFLSQNYPNPFKDRTTIKYCVPYRTRVQLTVYDLEGKLIKKIVEEEKIPGTYEIEFWTMVVGRQLEVGEYYYCLEAGNYTSEKKMQLIE